MSDHRATSPNVTYSEQMTVTTPGGSNAGGPSWRNAIADPVRCNILGLLGQSPLVTTTELVRASNASDPTLRRHLEALVALGIVREHRGVSDGLTRGRPAASYSLDPRARDGVLAVLGILNEPIGPSPRSAPWPG